MSGIDHDSSKNEILKAEERRNLKHKNNLYKQYLVDEEDLNLTYLKDDEEVDDDLLNKYIKRK